MAIKTTICIMMMAVMVSHRPAGPIMLHYICICTYIQYVYRYTVYRSSKLYKCIHCGWYICIALLECYIHTYSIIITGKTVNFKCHLNAT